MSVSMNCLKHWLRGFSFKPGRAAKCGLLLVLFGLVAVTVQAAPVKLLKVHFIDVGQADCILIQAPQGQNMLVDAGNRDDAPRITAYLTAQGVQRLRVVIGTHPHEDHIGGMAAIVKQFGVGKVYLPKVAANTRTYADLLATIKAKGLKVTTARAGATIKLQRAVRAQLLAPNKAKYEKLNNYSAVLKLTYGRHSFLLTGDAEAVSETEMLQRGYDLKADVLKVGHHGGAGSTSRDFLAAVAPQYAVISVGRNNVYKHPSRRTLNRLKKMKIQVYRTDLAGTILFTSDGRKALKVTLTKSKKIRRVKS
jgi:competence protein ComEC